MIFCALIATMLLASTAPDPLPILNLTADDTVVDRSCRVVIAPGEVIADANGDGVLHIAAAGITVEFAPGSVLHGAAPGADPDTYAGTGIHLSGHQNVTLRAVHVSGFKVGVHATDAGGLTLEDSRADDLWRMRLRSTPAAEDVADWLWPHRNDGHEWRTNYGAAFCIEESDGVTVRRCVVRRSQNGLILDRATNAKVYDNDFSFLSGWGLAMWRTSRSTISRNALDFCVRGYSHGVYNRGQDSAGILMFEQCSSNIIAENSVTHGGDGLFGFAGHEALGEAPAPSRGFEYARRGCNDNVLVANDFSYAPAHGIEMTFGFGNRCINNRLVENAICGVWGGYSQGTLIEGNEFAGNGLPGRGEGGGINIEHGHGNAISMNTFRGNTVGVSLWWDNDEGILKSPWAAANHKGSSDNLIQSNAFEGNAADIRLRRTTGTQLVGNAAAQGLRVDADAESPYQRSDDAVYFDDLPGAEAAGERVPIPGETRPVGARAHLRGRDKIIMGEWGPWDHESPLVRRTLSTGGFHLYEVRGVGEPVRASTETPGLGVTLTPLPEGGGTRVRVEPDGQPESRAGLVPYTVTLAAPSLPGGSATLRGTIVAADWTVRFFPWTVDPREDLAGWRAEADGPEAVATHSPTLELRFAHGGPADFPFRDRFGTIATTDLHLPKGRYRLTTLSDDGVRVLLTPSSPPSSPAAPQTLIENWTWHAPTRDAAEFTQPADGPVTLTVEYFELDGYAVLELAIEPVETDAPETPATGPR